jgi:ankyrin repeat protein
MELALLNGKTQVAEALIEDGAPLDPQASLVALVTAGVSDRDSVDLLMRQGADLNLPDAAGQPPLHQAVALGHLKTVQRLLQRGARVNQTDAQGMTPLTVAMGLDPRASDTASILATLIQFGAQPADGPAAAPDASPISNPGSTP